MALLMLGVASVNIHTQAGLITLIGLIAKSGILIVEFANQLQLREGLSRREAVECAGAIQLRPILMTTVSMIAAMVPLLSAHGPGGVSRFDIGPVIATRLGMGTIFTFFVVPAVYLPLARDHPRSGDSLLISGRGAATAAHALEASTDVTPPRGRENPADRWVEIKCTDPSIAARAHHRRRLRIPRVGSKAPASSQTALVPRPQVTRAIRCQRGYRGTTDEHRCT